MIMHNHGLLTVGKSARDAFVLMKHLIDAADIQLKLEATGKELVEIPRGLRQDRWIEHHDAGRGSMTGRPTCAFSTKSTRATVTERSARGLRKPHAGKACARRGCTLYGDTTRPHRRDRDDRGCVRL